VPFKETGDGRMVSKLEAAPVTMTDGTPTAYLAVRDRACTGWAWKQRMTWGPTLAAPCGLH